MFLSPLRRTTRSTGNRNAKPTKAAKPPHIAAPITQCGMSKDPDDWTHSTGGGPPSNGSGHSGQQFVIASEADPAIFGTMPKMRPAIRYGIDAQLIVISLSVMTYFLFYPDAFNACLAWLAKVF